MLVDKDQTLKIIDFGLSKYLKSGKTRNKTETMGWYENNIYNKLKISDN